MASLFLSTARPNIPFWQCWAQVLPLQQLSGASAKQSARRDGAGIASQLLQQQAMPPIPVCQHCVRTGVPFPGELLLDALLIGQVKAQTCKRQERELAAPQLPSSSSTKHLLAELMSLCYLTVYCRAAPLLLELYTWNKLKERRCICRGWLVECFLCCFDVTAFNILGTVGLFFLSRLA